MRCQNALALLAAGLAISACDQATGPADATDSAGLQAAADHVPDPSGERVVACKVGPVGSGPYDFTIEGPNNVGGAFMLDAGECLQVTLLGGDDVEDVTITEVDLPMGTQLDSIVYERFLDLGNEVKVTGQNFVTVQVAGDDPVNDRPRGATVVFFNGEVPPPPPPPPPPPGNEGCTPGYWKQTQHFDSWTAPYDPTDLFSDFFEDAFPGMSLLEVLENNGNKTGLEALGRHTVAALLNAASTGVNYGATTDDVIDAFNDVYPGTKGDYNDLKGMFAADNERGCPLN